MSQSEGQKAGRHRKPDKTGSGPEFFGRKASSPFEKRGSSGSEPTFTSLNGHDDLAFTVLANLARRNLKKGQQAMALAMIYPEPDKRGAATEEERKKLSILARSGFPRLALCCVIQLHSTVICSPIARSSMQH